MDQPTDTLFVDTIGLFLDLCSAAQSSKYLEWKRAAVFQDITSILTIATADGYRTSEREKTTAVVLPTPLTPRPLQPKSTTRRYQRPRRKPYELGERERWNCKYGGCSTFFRCTSTKSIRRHKDMCEYRHAPSALSPYEAAATVNSVAQSAPLYYQPQDALIPTHIHPFVQFAHINTHSTE